MIITSNQPGKNGKYHSKSGYYFVQHPEKYLSKTKPIFKSNLERLMMKYLDNNPNVINWIYEPRPIYYRDYSQIDHSTGRPGKQRKYFIDFVATVKTPDNHLKTIWIEVKSEKETHPPKNKNNKLEVETWIRNQSKWDAAKKLCESKGIEFVIITDEQLK